MTSISSETVELADAIWATRMSTGTFGPLEQAAAVLDGEGCTVLLRQKASGGRALVTNPRATEGTAILPFRSSSEASHPQKRQRVSEAPTAMQSKSVLMLLPDWVTQSRPTIECPNCRALYSVNANGQIRKHKCIVPLSALPCSALISKRPSEIAPNAA
mmetsp:Transcript_47284/g.94260  ORF Transcript_47284/g.94260 Transcript_47284/m.94260 type:complete len:159 (-) Transcript_47284:241-717(-)